MQSGTRLQTHGVSIWVVVIFGLAECLQDLLALEAELRVGRYGVAKTERQVVFAVKEAQ